MRYRFIYGYSRCPSGSFPAFPQHRSDKYTKKVGLSTLTIRLSRKGIMTPPAHLSASPSPLPSHFLPFVPIFPSYPYSSFPTHIPAISIHPIFFPSNPTSRHKHPPTLFPPENHLSAPPMTPNSPKTDLCPKRHHRMFWDRLRCISVFASNRKSPLHAPRRQVRFPAPKQICVPDNATVCSRTVCAAYLFSLPAGNHLNHGSDKMYSR